MEASQDNVLELVWCFADKIILMKVSSKRLCVVGDFLLKFYPVSITFSKAPEHRIKLYL
jgi:hypothetical protein